MNYLLFQQFDPTGHRTPSNCIWCGGPDRKNRSHVISRKLTTGSSNTPTLKFSICVSCNAKCGSLEQWIMRYTPLSWARLMLYNSLKSNTDTRSIPSYYFSNEIDDWVAFYLDTTRKSYCIYDQLIMLRYNKFKFISQNVTGSQSEIFEPIINCIMGNKFSNLIQESLPPDFSPRFLLDDNKLFLIARDRKSSDAIVELAKKIDLKHLEKKWMKLSHAGKERYHFRWSRLNWARFCAKIAYETLCLFKGGEECLKPCFSLVRDFVIGREISDGREVIFGENGPYSEKDVPAPVFLDLTAGQSAPSTITSIVPQTEPGMHYVSLYEVNGWILSSIVVSGFPPTILILAGPDEHLDDIYIMIYDDEDQEFEFLKLAYDHSKLTIPLPMPGKSLRDILNTYGLKPFEFRGE